VSLIRVETFCGFFEPDVSSLCSRNSHRMRVLMEFTWLRTRKLKVPVEGRVCLLCLMVEHNLLKKVCVSTVKVKVRRRTMGVKV